MADGLNRVLLLGNLGADPELRFTQGGQGVLNMRLCTTESYLDKDKVRQEKTEWHTLVMFGSRAEPLSKVLSKGSRILVEGKIHYGSYEKDGEKKYKTEIHVNNVVFAGGRGGGGDGSEGDHGAPEEPRAQNSSSAKQGGGGGRGGGRPSGGSYGRSPAGNGGGGDSRGGAPQRREEPQHHAPPADDFGYDGGGGDDIPF